MYGWCRLAGNVLHHTYPLEYHIFTSQPRQKSCWASLLRCAGREKRGEEEEQGRCLGAGRKTGGDGGRGMRVGWLKKSSCTSNFLTRMVMQSCRLGSLEEGIKHPEYLFIRFVQSPPTGGKGGGSRGAVGGGGVPGGVCGGRGHVQGELQGEVGRLTYINEGDNAIFWWDRYRPSQHPFLSTTFSSTVQLF